MFEKSCWYSERLGRESCLAAFQGAMSDNRGSVNSPSARSRARASIPALMPPMHTLPEPLDEIALGAGEVRTLEWQRDFLVECDAPVQLAQFIVGQTAVIGGTSAPAGDPSFIMVAPIEQHRVDHAVYVPEGYGFDFVLIAVPSAADVEIDGTRIEDLPYCSRSLVGTVTVEKAAVDFDAVRCALSEPIVTSGPPVGLDPGVQRDGAHRVVSSLPAGVVVYGFDGFVSYGYAAGTELRILDGN